MARKKKPQAKSTPRKNAAGKGEASPPPVNPPQPGREEQAEPQPDELFGREQSAASDARLIRRGINEGWFNPPAQLNEFIMRRNGRFIISHGQGGNGREFANHVKLHMEMLKHNRGLMQIEIERRKADIEEETFDTPIRLPQGGPWDMPPDRLQQPDPDTVDEASGDPDAME